MISPIRCRRVDAGRRSVGMRLSGAGGRGEFGYVRTGNQTDPQLGAVPLVPVIDRQPFAKLCRCGADNVIQVGVVRRRPSKYLDADRPFLDLFPSALQRLFDHILEESDRSSAGTEDLIPCQQFKLSKDHLGGQTRRNPAKEVNVRHVPPMRAILAF